VSKNGGGVGNFSKVKRLVQKCIGTHKPLFSAFSFFSVPMWDFRNTGTFSQNILKQHQSITYKTTYAYLSLLMGCWDMQENLDSDLFWAGDGQFCGDFTPF